MITTDSALHATTIEVDFAHDSALLGLLPHLKPSGVWIREGHGMIGLGTAARTSASGRSRFAQLARWWESLDLLGEDAEAVPAPGAGPVAFTTITYSAESEHASELIVPQLVIGSSPQGVWLSAVAPEGTDFHQLLADHGLRLQDSKLALTSTEPAEPMPATVRRPGRQSERSYLSAVAAGLSAIDDGAVEKLVLARDEVVTAEAEIPVGTLLSRLADEYSNCWTYFVDDVLGATPEMLVSVRSDQVFSRVLAGTVAHDAQAEWAHAGLLGDLKQNHEHQLAVYSLVEQLHPAVESLQPQPEPRVLELPNVYHLATDITGRLQRGAGGELPSPLIVAEHAHPTAAVCGTPTPQADQLLALLEGLDRGPFAGPVGWIDARGNADFGIALRGAVLENASTARLYAGCGVVAGSEPESELAETHAKLRVMLSALGA